MEGLVPPSGVKHEEYWSAPQVQVQLGAAAADVALPLVNVDTLPVGVNIVQVLAFFRFRMIENTNALANAILGLQYIQLQPTGGAWANVIAIVDNLFTMAATTREEGFTLVGDMAAAMVVNANDTYQFRWEQGVVDVNNMNFDDVQTGLRIFYI